jgi:acetyltransferase-like isoleucine patch superfamily enzyme
MTEKRQRVDKIPLAEQLHAGKMSAFARYRNKAAGEGNLVFFLMYEVFHLALANLGGAVGYLLRKLAAPSIFAKVGTGLILGRGVTLRHPGRVILGDNVAIDDGVLLDAAGAGKDGIVLGDNVIVSRGCLIQGKTGPVHFSSRADIGCNCVFSSVAGIRIGEAVIIAGNCYLGGGRYYHDTRDQPIMDQGGYSHGELVVGDHSWIGAGAIVLDGVKLGRGVIVGAGAVVTHDVVDFAIVAGVPARVVRMRKDNQAASGNRPDECI